VHIRACDNEAWSIGVHIRACGNEAWSIRRCAPIGSAEPAVAATGRAPHRKSAGDLKTTGTRPV